MSTEHGEQKKFWRSPAGIAFAVFAVAAAYFLWIEHREHVVSFLPYTFLLVCVGMHFFMHGGHGGHGGHGAHKKDEDGATK